MPSAAAIRKMRRTLRALDREERLAFSPLLDADRLDPAIARHVIDFRDRLFPPDLTLCAFLSQVSGADRSCRAAVVRANAGRRRARQRKSSSSTSAYCQARARLPVGLVEELARQSAGSLERRVDRRWLWKGRHVKLIDGTTLSMPDTEENQQQWPQNPAQKAGLGFPIVRLVAVVSLATAAVLDLRFGPYQGEDTSELALARQMLDTVEAGDVVLADRYFAGYFFMALVKARGADIVTRLHGARHADFRQGRHLSQGDHVIELIKPPRPKWMDEATYQALPETLELREVKGSSRDRDGKQIVVVTTLVDPKRYSKSELLAVSRLRWNVELDLRSIKSVMGMDILSCQTPQMVAKEVWTYILAYNLIRELIARAAQEHGIEPRNISFTGAVQAFQAYAPHFDWRDPAKTKDLYASMLEDIASFRIGNRPGRREPRAVKRRPKKTRFLTKPRTEMKSAKKLT